MIPGGQILGPTPNLVNASTVTAEKVANIAAPASATTVWDKLSQKQGIATTPKMAGGMTSLSPGTYGTSRLQHLSSQLAENSRYKLDLPNLAGRPKQGIASSMQEVAGGIGSGAQKGNTVYVDDKNWPVTLKEIIGSRMLTPAQLEAASIQNVKKLISVGNPGVVRNAMERSVGNKDENEELYYMFQRMMLEGFVRGVDITKELKAQGGLDISIKTAPLAANPRNIGLSQTLQGKADQVGFNARYWRGASEAEKYTLFMHEIGHNLLNRDHNADPNDIESSGHTNSNAKRLLSSKEMYNNMLNDHFGSATNKGTIAIARQQAGTGTVKFDPSWFPQLSGEQVAIGGNGYTPGDSGSGGSDAPAPKDYTNDFKGINDNFALLSKMMEAQNESMQQFQEQQSIMNVNTQAPQTSVGQTQLLAPTVAQTGGLMGGAMGGSIDTTGFAQQLQALGSGGGEAGAGNLLSSG